MNLIVENSPQIQWYTDLHPFLECLGDSVYSFDWVFDEVDARVSFPKGSEFNEVWKLSGKQFKELVKDHPQFVWSVVSAFYTADSKPIPLDGDRPYAVGNPNFWTGSPKPQLLNAEFEIVCWDSSSTLLIGASEFIADAFRRAYPGVLDLDNENAKRVK